MAEQPMVGCRIPPEWKTEIEAIAKARGKKAAQIIYEAIAAYLKKTSDNGVINALERIEAIEKKLESLDSVISTITALSERVYSVEQANRSESPKKTLMSGVKSSQPGKPLHQSKPLRVEAPLPEEGMTLEQVAMTIGLNYTNLVGRRKKMSQDEFLEYLQQKSGDVWQFDATAGRYGKYFLQED